MRIALLVLVVMAACSDLGPSLDSCPSGEEVCGLFEGPCFDPTSTTTTCCAGFFGSPEICTAKETCDDETISCRPDTWSNVVCVGGTAPGKTPSGYRGSYQVQPPNEATLGGLPSHEYELQFDEGCGVGTLSGPAMVTFDGTVHNATWTAGQTDAGPFTFSGDPTLGLRSIAVLSWDAATGFHGDVTDAYGTHTVAFTFTYEAP